MDILSSVEAKTALVYPKNDP